MLLSDWFNRFSPLPFRKAFPHDFLFYLLGYLERETKEVLETPRKLGTSAEVLALCTNSTAAYMWPLQKYKAKIGRPRRMRSLLIRRSTMRTLVSPNVFGLYVHISRVSRESKVMNLGTSIVEGNISITGLVSTDVLPQSFSTD